LGKSSNILLASADVWGGFVEKSLDLLLAAAYYAARQFGMEGEVQNLLNEAAPYICTCQEDVAGLAQIFGASSANTAKFETCV
jgi:hypothetical protein